jgi:polar amino acid transport system substrate-binding protein
MRNVGILAAVLVAAALSACASTSDKSSAPTGDECTKATMNTLYKGIFTFGTDQPAYPPWFMGDNPSNGEGFESAVANAVAEKLGYAKEDVRWVRVPFSVAIGPGPKSFDSDLSQFSITDQRKDAVDFSSAYFDVTQAVVTVKSSPAAAVRTVDGFKNLRLGAQVGTTSYTAAAALNGSVPVRVYNTNADAKMALLNGQIDALVLDLPTAFSVQGELNDGVIVGQLPSSADKSEQFGIVLDKDSPLTKCVSTAVDQLGDDGVLFKLQKVWLTGAGNAPMLS